MASDLKYVRVKYRKSKRESTLPIDRIKLKGADNKFYKYVPGDDDIQLKKVVYVSTICEGPQCPTKVQHHHNHLATILCCGDSAEAISSMLADKRSRNPLNQASTGSSSPANPVDGEKQTSAQSKSVKTRTQKRAQDGEPKGLRKNHQKYLVSKNNQFIDSDQESDDSSVPVKSSSLNSASHDHSKNHLPEEIAVGDTKVTQPRPKKRKSQESLDNLPDRKKRKKSKSDWVCLEDSSDLGFLQTFIGTDGETVRIHLGLGIKIDYETWIKAVNTFDDTKLLRKLIYSVWKPEEIINRFVQETDNLNDWEGQEPRKKVEKDRVKLVKDLFKWILKNRDVSMLDTYTRLRVVNSMLSRVIQDVRRMAQFKDWVPVARRKKVTLES
ncbi:hypothetical protein QAD02_021690 [Eretmocerus hayati]|uniref:Uncharacterized protein n=1 Tax=Eretmocerus hayati TaxID=131215 RepID=A0ACC2PR67_9HYME|nr:hypothetical protein QAD02_021690 [Eretmocerus hayati]